MEDLVLALVVAVTLLGGGLFKTRKSLAQLIAAKGPGRQP